MTPTDSAIPSGFTDLLRHSGFRAFLWTQFLGAFNDNTYKIIVSMRAVHVAANTGSGGEYLSLATAVFVIPFLLFSGYSGHLADRVSKRTVLIGVKIFEIAIMLLGLAAFLSTRIELMLAVLFLLALHSTIFSPAKYGIVPEMLRDKDLSRANALLEMSTFVAIVMGTSIGSFLFTMWKDEPWKMGVVALGVACLGLLTSFKITAVRAAGTTEPFRLNPFGEVITGTRHLLKDRPLWLTVMAISYFWFLGALFQMNILLFGSEVLKVSDLQVGLMVTSLAIGIGAGSMLAGRLSGDKVELGLVPLGSVFMGVFCIGLYVVSPSYPLCVLMLALLGLASGLFIVPLNAYLQQRSDDSEKGRIIGTNNFYNTIGLLLASGALSGLHDRLHVSTDKLMLIFGLVTLGMTYFIVKVVPEFLVRFLLWTLTHTVFKIRIIGEENVPFRGPALLVANHMSQVDGFLIGGCVQRFIRFMVWKPYYELKALNWFFKLTQAIPVGTNGPRDAVHSIRQARKELTEGHVVCIFAEGAITRTGNLLPFKRGLENIANGLDIPIIPVHLDRLWGSIFSFEGGKFFWKWPKQIPYPVTVSFGKPLPSNATAHEVRQAISELATDATQYRKSSEQVLPLRFVRSARQNWSKFAMADTTGRELKYGEALTGSLLIAEWVRKNHRDEKMIGVLLPSSVGGALVNVGVTMAGKVPVNLNFTAGKESITLAAEQCNLRTTITSRAFLAKAKIDFIESPVFVEDIVAASTPAGKAMAFAKARLMPARMLVKRVSGAKLDPDAVATIIFSSGSTGIPKGVMLSHYNIISNIEAMGQVFWINEQDRIIGVLPFFHSFGFTVTLWFPLLAGCGVAYHPNPMDAKAIGELVAKYKGTFLLSTPTFCGNYVRACSAEEFATLRFVLAGAEKMRESIAEAFEKKFGLRPLEGYGCTEMSPVVSVNAPNFEMGKDTQVKSKTGTVGHPMPGVSVRAVDFDTLEPLPVNREGLLLVRGPNLMLGYLGDEARTKEAMQNGWYVTGDIASVDDDGFIRITGRISRFSKIGGEMVPHTKVEQALLEAVSDTECAVIGVPDEQRGERLVAFYTRQDMTPSEVWDRLSRTEIPRLWLPKRQNIYQLEALPTLGTGKLDLRAVKKLAAERETARATEA